MSAFAETETNLQTVLWHFAGVASPTAPAVFSGVKTDAAMGLLKRIAEAQEWSDEPKDELIYLSLQLGQINQLRNDILHFGARHTGPDTWVVSNKLFAHTADRLRETHITPTTLNDAASDLHKIDGHLTVLAWGEFMPADTRAVFSENAKHAWRYKPPPPKQSPKKTRDGIPRRPRQRRSLPQ